MNSQPLVGRTIVVTRAASQASGLLRMLSSLGATSLALPLIEVVAPSDQGRALDSAVDSLASYDWVACTSANAARAVLTSLGERAWPAGTRVSAVGQASANALLDAGVAVAVVPAKATAKRLAQSMVREFGLGGSSRQQGSGHAPNPVRVLAPLAELAAPDLVDGLTSPGIHVDRVEAYRTVVPTHDDAAFDVAARADVILLSSASTADRLLDRVGLNPKAKLVCIGPQTAARVEERGAIVAAIANPHTEIGLIAATVNTIGA